jgi:hypothetical protein
MPLNYNLADTTYTTVSATTCYTGPLDNVDLVNPEDPGLQCRAVRNANNTPNREKTTARAAEKGNIITGQDKVGE